MFHPVTNVLAENNENPKVANLHEQTNAHTWSTIDNSKQQEQEQAQEHRQLSNSLSLWYYFKGSCLIYATAQEALKLSGLFFKKFHPK